MEQTNSGPIVFDDVTQALGETDPSTTNAGKLRAILGRGSYATIQKHLDAIRDQRREAEQPKETPAVPPMPPEILGMWSAAVGVAVLQVRTRLDAVVQERDALVPALATARADLQALTAELEATFSRAEGLEVSIDKVVEAREATAAEHEKKLKNLADEQALQSQEREAQHGLVLSSLQSELDAARKKIEVQELQAVIAAQAAASATASTINRLTDQIGELKSMLHDRSNFEQKKEK